MNDNKKPMVNALVMLRQEFDDWAVLFDPDSGHGFGLNPAGVYLWKLLDGEHSLDAMLEALRRDALDVPGEAGEQIVAFVEELTQHGLASYDVASSHGQSGCSSPCPAGAPENAPNRGPETGQFREGTKLRYERPRLETFTLERSAHGAYCMQGTTASDVCSTGLGATGAGGGTMGTCVNNGSSAIQTPWTYGKYACYNGPVASCQSGYYPCNGGNSAF